MKFYTNQHKYYCGIDLHTRKMYVCILDEKGEIREHRNLNTDRDAFLKAIAPFREDIVVAVECIFTWYWVADLCHNEGIPFVFEVSVISSTILRIDRKHVIIRNSLAFSTEFHPHYSYSFQQLQLIWSHPCGGVTPCNGPHPEVTLVR